MASLVLENIVKRYGKLTALDNISFTVNDGEFIVLLGPSGAGKTTTLKVIAGVEPIQEGYVYIDGKLMNPLEPHERDVTMAYESYALYPHFTVYENLAFPLRHPRFEMREADIQQRVHRVAELLNIHMLLDRRPVELSNGQKQRTSLGRCLVREPKIFLLDEPLSHLDAKLRHHMRTEFKRLESMLTSTIVYVTHDYTEALSLADRIVAIDKGQIQQIGSPSELYDNPVNEFVARLFGEPQINLIEGHVVTEDQIMFFVSDDGAIKVPIRDILQQRLRKQAFGRLRLGIRPLSVRLASREIDQNGHVAKGSVYVFERLGTKGVLTFNLGQRRLQALTGVDLQFTPDEPVTVSFDTEKTMLFDCESGRNILSA